jgi:3-oxoacyl-[acyl-carrier protein] reductase
MAPRPEDHLSRVPTPRADQAVTRTVVVSGGGTGMGRAIAQRFLSQGAEVVILGRRPEVLGRVVLENPGLPVQGITVDLTDPSEVLRLRDQLDGRRIDVLVNNAGGVGAPTAPGIEGVFDGYRRVIEQNLLSAMMLTEALWPALVRPGARVVTIGSIAGQRGGGGAYGAAKAGLVAWGHELAARGGPEGITVNTVAPGYVQDTEFFTEQGRSARHDALVAQTLVGRAGTPADVASAVEYLTSPDAAWVTGQVLSVNGGALLGR